MPATFIGLSCFRDGALDCDSLINKGELCHNRANKSWLESVMRSLEPYKS